MGVFPGRDTKCAGSGCFLGEIGGARKTGVPRTKVFTMFCTIIV